MKKSLPAREDGGRSILSNAVWCVVTVNSNLDSINCNDSALIHLLFILPASISGTDPDQIYTMPPKPRRKGPAHQNSFAYRHNPNSKKTKQILESPNVHVCRRCHEKIEWRKQYRKYKPRTQPGSCICCRLKRVTAAYHTICEPCSRTSVKARKLLDEWNKKKQTFAEDAEKDIVEQGKDSEENPAVEESPETEEENGAETEEEVSKKEPHDEEQDDDDDEHDDDDDEHEDSNSDEPRKPRVYRRVCAMCVKEPALAGESDEEDEFDETLKHLDRPLKLRERKRLERLAEKKSKSNRRRTRPEEEKEEHDEEVDRPQEAEEDYSGDDDEDNDPLLKAVGGADKLLTGEAYQAKLLEQAAK